MKVLINKDNYRKKLTNEILTDLLCFEVTDFTTHDCEQKELLLNRLNPTKEEYYITIEEVNNLIQKKRIKPLHPLHLE